VNCRLTFIASFTDVVRFHGHRCPGLALGYRASEIALHELGATRSEDEELVCIVENDACGVDAVQYLTGCTLGKGNLILRTYGKNVYTFINRKTGDAVRIVQRPDVSTRRIDSRAGDLRQWVMAGTATPEEQEEYRERMDHVIAMILQIPPEGIFTIRHVHMTVPETARIFTSIPCARCGELVAEPLTRVYEGRIVCIPCSEAVKGGR
jgi:formylmethanofuran dehydrogenase subunit E